MSMLTARFLLRQRRKKVPWKGIRKGPLLVLPRTNKRKR